MGSPRMEPVGQVAGYFAQPSAAVVRLTAALRVGDVIYVKGATSDFQQVVESMQVAHQPVQDAAAGSEVGVRVAQKCRRHDVVYKLTIASS